MKKETKRRKKGQLERSEREREGGGRDWRGLGGGRRNADLYECAHENIGIYIEDNDIFSVFIARVHINLRISRCAVHRH